MAKQQEVCFLCGKSKSEVHRLIKGQIGYVCDKCVQIAYDTFNEKEEEEIAQTGKGIMERFCEDHGIPTYSVDRETGIMKNNQTGDIMKPKTVSHLHIVK